MKKYIISIGEECEDGWSEEETKEYNSPIRKFLTELYPQAYSKNLGWNASSDKGVGGYGISKNMKNFEYFLAEDVIAATLYDGYEVMTRDQMVYSQNLQKILGE